MKTAISTVLIILLLTMIGMSNAKAQNINALLKAVDKIEASLAKMVQQEAATRNQQTSELKASISKQGGSALLSKSVLTVRTKIHSPGLTVCLPALRSAPRGNLHTVFR